MYWLAIGGNVATTKSTYVLVTVTRGDEIPFSWIKWVGLDL